MPPPELFWRGASVLVTGGSGVVGSALVRSLVAAGAEVGALARSAEAAAAVEGLGAIAIDGDVLSQDSVATAVANRQFVFHVAGVNELCPKDPGRLWAVNVDGTRNVVRSADGAGVERVVVTSSVTALGNPAGRPAVESDQPVGRFSSKYAESKWAGEKIALAEAGKAKVVVVNPASVQGPGRATGTGKIILDLAAGRLPALVDATVSIVDIDDCAAGHLAACRLGSPGQRYILSGFTISIRQAVELLEGLIGERLGIRFVPASLARVLGPLLAPISRVVGGPPLCREAVRTMTASHSYDGSRAERELGIAYRTPEETIRRFLAWANDTGMIDRPLVGRSPGGV